jgi:tetratricopeptide (TPR) repeat protein
MLRDIWLYAAAATILLLAAHGLSGAAPPDQSPSKLASQPKRPADMLISPSAASRFWQVGYELSQRPGITESQADQAIILLVAAKSLDPQIQGLEPLLIELATQHSSKDYTQHVFLWLQAYVGTAPVPNALADGAVVGGVDHRLVKKAVQYLLDHRKSPDERRKLLEDLIAKIGNRNPAVDSELATMLGLLVLEQGDRKAAKFYFTQAYRKSKYNTTAFGKLSELAPEELTPATYLEHLRLVIRRNPLDMDAALMFAKYAARMQLHDVAVGAYQYCTQVSQYLQPNQPWPASVYLPWAIAAYNSNGQQAVAMQIAQTVRKSGRFDILLEAIAGRTAAKLGKAQESQQILAQAEQKALQLLQTQESRLTVESPNTSADQGPKQMAWFYCFAQEDPVKALDWSNRCYAADPNSQISISLLAYSLAMTKQWDLVGKVVALDMPTPNQITLVAYAQLQMTQGSRDEAAKTLRSAIARDPGSFAAEKAKSLLASLGEKYTDADAGASLAALTRSFGQGLVPRFMPPGQMLEARISLPSAAFAYGIEIVGNVSILNKSPEPLVITDKSLFTGRIRIDVRTNGYLKRSCPNLVSQPLGTQVEVPPGRSLTASIPLSTGELRSLLMDHPQAGLGLEFTLYLDPVEAEGGVVRCKLADVKPAVCVADRTAVDVDGNYLQGRFKTISTGQESQKAFTAQLFAGLINEQAMMAKLGPIYPIKYADWMRDMLHTAFVSESGLLLSPGPDDWPVKIHAMTDMLTMKLDQQMATVVARNLGDPKWPVRLMTLYLLSVNGGGGFDKMLDWVWQNETDDLVRGMATALRPTR